MFVCVEKERCSAALTSDEDSPHQFEAKQSAQCIGRANLKVQRSKEKPHSTKEEKKKKKAKRAKHKGPKEGRRRGAEVGDSHGSVPVMLIPLH